MGTGANIRAVRGTTENSGLEGLSPLALRRIANDPKNPRAAQARVVLQQMEADARAATAETMAQPQYDPAQYGQ